jgi:hypothetical protein
MSQGFLQFVLIFFLAVGLALYLFNPAYAIIFAKAFFITLNAIFAFFVFRNLIDMNHHYQTKIYPFFFIIGFAILIYPILVLIGLFLF